MLTGEQSGRVLGWLLIATLAVRVVMFAATGFSLDDPFITYRYATHIAHGDGFVYQEGERIQGTTTPLFTLLLAVVGIVFGTSTIPMASIVISIAADMISVLLLWRILGPERMLPCLLFALYPKTVLIGVSGMEASLVVALMLGSFAFMREEQWAGAYLLFGILLLVRLDGAIWIGATLFVFLLVRRTAGIRYSLITVAIVAPWLIFAALYFGSPIPHSIVAKRISWDHLFPAFDPVRVLIHYFPFEGMATLGIWPKTLLALLFIFPVLIDLKGRIAEKSIMMVFPVFFILYTLFFSVAKVSPDIWYYLPGFAAYFVSLGGLLDRFVASRRESLRLALLVVLIGLLGVAVIRWSRNPGDWFHRNYMALGNWLAAHGTPRQSVFLEGIGYVGWKTEMHIYDSVGLVSQDVLNYRLQFPGTDVWYMRFLRDTQPVYIVLRNWEVPKDSIFLGYGEGLFTGDGDREWFERSYRQVAWNEGARMDSVHFVLYERTGK